MLAKTEEKSKVQAERIVAAAHESIEKDVIAAKKALHNETIELEPLKPRKKSVGKTVNAGVDKQLITQSIKEVEA